MADPVTLLPSGEQTPDDALIALEDDLTLDSSPDLTVAADIVQPLGRSYRADFTQPNIFGSTPSPNYGLAALQTWITKCLMSERGSCPIWPPGYGMRGVTDGIGEPFTSPALADRADRIREALTFHPRISDVQGYRADFDPSDEAWMERFTVILDDETTLEITS